MKYLPPRKGLRARFGDFIDWWAWVDNSDPVHHTLSRGFAMSLLLWFGIIIFVMILNLAFQWGNSAVSNWWFVPIVAGMFFSWWLNRNGSILGVWLIVAMSIFTGVFLVSPEVYTNNPIIIPAGFIIPVIIASRFLSSKAGVATWGITIVAIGLAMLGLSIDVERIRLFLLSAAIGLGTLTTITGVIGEITYRALRDLHDSNEALTESEARFRLLAEQAPVQIWMSDHDGSYTYFNRRWLRFSGRDLAEEVGFGWMQRIHPADFKERRDLYEKALATRRPFELDFRLQRADGEFRWLAESAEPRFQGPKFLGFIGTADDITVRKDAEAIVINSYDRTLEALVRALDLRDKETEGHSQRVTAKTVEIAREMGASDAELVNIRRGALLHDIGKLGIPDSILLKPGSLSEEEWAIMKMHPTYAFDMLFPILYLREALDIPLYHHEWYNGKGYPRGLKGEEIPLPARIFAVVDVWDALRSDRPYRKGMADLDVLDTLKAGSGTHFDPLVVATFVGMYKMNGDERHA